MGDLIRRFVSWRVSRISIFSGLSVFPFFFIFVAIFVVVFGVR
jgi:hypothetical protein